MNVGYPHFGIRSLFDGLSGWRAVNRAGSCLAIVVGFLLLATTQAQNTVPSTSVSREDAWLVGTYYYPWYEEPRQEGSIGWMRQALRGRLQPRQMPALSVYSSRDPEVIGAHIDMCADAGIDFWAVSWWGPGRREDRTLLEGILPHPKASRLKYALLYESTGRLGGFDKPNYESFVTDFEYMAEHYFEDPQYLKVEGRPVVFLYLTRVYFRHRGQEALAALRERFPKLFLVGDDVFGPGYRPEYARPWDAVTAYDIYGQSMQVLGATHAGVQQLNDNYRTASEAAHQVGSAFVPGIAPGYNDRAVRKGHPGRPRYFKDDPNSKEGDIFRSMIRDVALPLSDPKAHRMWMITSFNEWYEDTQIEPTSGKVLATRKDDSESGDDYAEGDVYRDYGTLYLDILRETLSTAGTPSSASH